MSDQTPEAWRWDASQNELSWETRHSSCHKYVVLFFKLNLHSCLYSRLWRVFNHYFCIVYSINGIVESAPGPRGGGGRGAGSTGGGKNSSSGGKRSGYYLHGGLYPVSRTAKEVPPVKTPISRGIGAWGIIGIVLAVLTLCCGIYYALYLCDLYQRTDNYTSNLAAQSPHLLTDKPKPEENGNGNIPMTDKNELANINGQWNFPTKCSSLKSSYKMLSIQFVFWFDLWVLRLF